MSRFWCRPWVFLFSSEGNRLFLNLLWGCSGHPRTRRVMPVNLWKMRKTADSTKSETLRSLLSLSFCFCYRGKYPLSVTSWLKLALRCSFSQRPKRYRWRTILPPRLTITDSNGNWDEQSPRILQFQKWYLLPETFGKWSAVGISLFRFAGNWWLIFRALVQHANRKSTKNHWARFPLFFHRSGIFWSG